MLIGVPKEIKNHEYRIGLTPSGARELVANGHQVIVQRDGGKAMGGVGASFPRVRRSRWISPPRTLQAPVDMWFSCLTQTSVPMRSAKSGPRYCDVPWNTARLINHSCDANCESDTIRGHIWIKARRDIAAGEELAYDYGFDLANWRDHPCRCGTKKCVGYIVTKTQRWRVKKHLAKARRAERAA